MSAHSLKAASPSALMYVEELFKLSLAAYTKASNLSSFASTMLYELKDLKKIFFIFSNVPVALVHIINW